MAEGFGTSVEEMQRAGQHVLSVNDAVQANLATLRARLMPLPGAWSGEAAREFAGLMERWNTDARNLSDALRAIGESITSSGQSYQAMEQQSSDEMSTIRQALG